MTMSRNQYGLGSALMRTPVVVLPTPTEIIAPFRAIGQYQVSFELINDSIGQIISARVHVSGDEAGPWEELNWLGLDEIDPLASRNRVFDCQGYQWLRLVATTDGLGADARITWWRHDHPAG